MTLREHLEWLRDHGHSSGYGHAVDALEILDSCELISDYAGGSRTEKSHWRHVPDPQPPSTGADWIESGRVA